MSGEGKGVCNASRLTSRGGRFALVKEKRPGKKRKKR